MDTRRVAFFANKRKNIGRIICGCVYFQWHHLDSVIRSATSVWQQLLMAIDWVFFLLLVVEPLLPFPSIAFALLLYFFMILFDFLFLLLVLRVPWCPLTLFSVSSWLIFFFCSLFSSSSLLYLCDWPRLDRPDRFSLFFLFVFVPRRRQKHSAHATNTNIFCRN